MPRLRRLGRRSRKGFPAIPYSALGSFADTALARRSMGRRPPRQRGDGPLIGSRSARGCARRPRHGCGSCPPAGTRPRVMPCGYRVARIAAEFSNVQFPSSWPSLPAVRERRIFAVDANAHFSRPGSRLADGVALLAHLCHPDLFPADGLTESFRAI
jgi:hypothetical protein